MFKTTSYLGTNTIYREVINIINTISATTLLHLLIFDSSEVSYNAHHRLRHPFKLHTIYINLHTISPQVPPIGFHVAIVFVSPKIHINRFNIPQLFNIPDEVPQA